MEYVYIILKDVFIEFNGVWMGFVDSKRLFHIEEPYTDHCSGGGCGYSYFQDKDGVLYKNAALQGRIAA